MTSLAAAGATFRDPAGSLRIIEDRVLRTVRADFAKDCLSFLRSEVAQAWMTSGRLVHTRILQEVEGQELELESPSNYRDTTIRGLWHPRSLSCAQWWGIWKYRNLEIPIVPGNRH